MKVKIESGSAQGVSAAQIEALANHILVMKGDYDFSGTNVVVTPPADMDADLAGIIVAASNSGVQIQGASDMQEYVAALKGNVPQWANDVSALYGIPVSNIVNAFVGFWDCKHSLVSNSDKRPHLVSAGNACIPTDYVMRKDTFDAEVEVYEVVKTAILGNGVYNQANHFMLASYSTSQDGYLVGLPNGSYVTVKRTYNKWHTIKLNNSRFSDDGVETAMSGSGTCSLPLYICGCSGGASAEGCKFSKFIFREDNVVTAFFVPYKMNGVYGMYDVVGEKFYAPESGEFGYGISD